MSELKQSLKRLGRLVQLRETYVSVAEAAVKEAEVEVRRLEAADREVVGHIQHTQAEIAYLKTTTGGDVQLSARYIQSLEKQRKTIQLSIEQATGHLELRRCDWTEAMRAQKIVEKLQERRLHQSERAQDVELQKVQDEAYIGRYVRTRLEK